MNIDRKSSPDFRARMQKRPGLSAGASMARSIPTRISVSIHATRRRRPTSTGVSLALGDAKRRHAPQ